MYHRSLFVCSLFTVIRYFTYLISHIFIMGIYLLKILRQPLFRNSTMYIALKN